jgi:hypothetical protein
MNAPLLVEVLVTAFDTHSGVVGPSDAPLRIDQVRVGQRGLALSLP